jgi:hypothetical protein
LFKNFELFFQKTKVKQGKPVGESTQTIFEKLRLDPTFAVEEESDKDSVKIKNIKFMSF